MTTQLTIFDTLDCTRVYPETPAAARDETLAARVARDGWDRHGNESPASAEVP